MEGCAALLDVVFGGSVNGRSFENCGRTIVELKLVFLRTLFEWVSVRGSVSCVFALVIGFLFFASSICLYS